MRLPVRFVLLLGFLLAGDVGAAGGAPFPLRADGTRLVGADGRDFHVVGDAAWTLIVSLTLDEAEAYLEARKAAGFNTILVELVERGHAGPADRNGNLPFPEERPFTAPSPAYFRHARAVLDLALEHGFLVLLAPAYVGYRCDPKNWCDELRRTPDADLEAYGRYVGGLLAGYPNLVWVHGGDVDARTYGVLGKVEAVYRGIAAVLPGALHTGHCSRNFSAIDCYERPWLNVNTTYSDCELTPAKVHLDRLRAPALPSIYIEGSYEEEKSTPLCVRSQLWWSYLGGSVGHVFGNKRIWQFEPDWRSALDTPGTRAMTVASGLLDRLRDAGEHLEPVPSGESPVRVDPLASAWYRWWEWSYPRSLAWTTAVNRGDEVPVAASATTTVAYLPYATRFAYVGGHGVLCWVEPRTGEALPLEDDVTAIRTPDAGDWLFVAEAAPRLCVS